jgi:ketosteroid isomerase-like protein
MSQGSAQLVRDFIEVWNAFFRDGGDPAAHLRTFFDPAVEIDFSRRQLDAEVYRGYDGAARFLEELREPWEEFRIEPEELIEAGDAVVAFGNVTGRAKQSGITIDTAVGYLVSLREGRIASIVYFGEDRAACLEAAGLAG